MTSAIPSAARANRSSHWPAQFPDLRRFIREGYVRYAFTRFGVPYVVSIQCLDSAPRPRRLACREAYPVAERFLKALRVAGGLPSRPRMDIASAIVERPLADAADFTYRPAGDIIANSGARKQGGRCRLHRLFANPVSAGQRLRLSSTRSRFGTAGQATSRSTSWRAEIPVIPGGIIFAKPAVLMWDSAPSGFGHQGEDIRPAPCPPEAMAPSAATPSSRRSSPSATAC